MLNKVLRLKYSIAMVYKSPILNLFFTNQRKNVNLEIEWDEIINFLSNFNGEKKLFEILDLFTTIDKDEALQLVVFLLKKYALIEVDIEYDLRIYEKKYRIINFLEDFCQTTSEVIGSMSRLEQSTVAIVGLGGVGTWITESLARCGVGNFILIDNDTVDITNIHRQNFFNETNIGQFKVDAVANGVKNIDPIINIIKINDELGPSFFNNYTIAFDLMINCADNPSVDQTSEWVASECMQRNIPHIIGGGYNLHLSLIGQTIIPNITACYECFNQKLSMINQIDLNGVKKLNRLNRKIGSFLPLTALSASLTSIDALLTIIHKYEFLINTNKRIEFNESIRDFNFFEITKNKNCSWCGINGKYEVLI